MADKKITEYDVVDFTKSSTKLLGVKSGRTKQVQLGSAAEHDATDFAAANHTHSDMVKTVTVNGTTYSPTDGDVAFNVEGGSVTVDDALSSTSENPVQNKVIKGVLDTKVDAVSGKGLSTNDYTTAEKTKLSGIAENADVNVIEGVSVNNTALTPTNKVVNIDLSGYVESSSLATVATSGDYTDLQNKPDLSGYAQTTDLSAVATSGSYNDLNNKPNVYTKQESDDMFLKGESSVVTMPEGYEQVSNIKTSGEQYINTGYTPNPSTFGFFIDVKTEDEIANTNAAHIFVAGKRTDNAKYRVALTMYSQTSGGEVRIGASTDKNPRLAKNLHTTLEVKEKVITYPNGDTTTITTAIEDISCSTSLYLFALNNNGTMQRFATCRLYRFQIYEGSTLVRDFVPSRRIADGKLGMYELLGTYNGETGHFFTNEGSGADFTVEDTIGGLGDFVNNTTIVSDPNYVHTDNNFTTSLKNQIGTNATNINNLQQSIPAVVDATLEYDLISVYNTNIYRAEIVDFDYDIGQAPTAPCDIQADVTVNLYTDTDGSLTKIGEFAMTSRGKFTNTTVDMGGGQSIQAEHVTLPLMFGQNYIVDCDIVGIASQYTLVTPTTLVEDAIEQKANYSDIQLTQATFNGYMRSGEYYVLSEPVSSLSIQVSSYNTAQESTITFTVSGSSFDVTLPVGTKIIGDKPLFTNGSTYIMSFFNGMVVFGEVNTYVNPA